MKVWKKNYVKENLISILIIGAPFLLYVHLLFTGKDDYLILLGYRVYNWTGSNEAFAWYILNDLVPLLLLVLMFFTIPFKWKYLLLPIISLYFLSILLSLDVFTTFKESILSVNSFVYSLLFVTFLVLMDIKTSDKFLLNSYHLKAIQNFDLQTSHDFKSITKRIKLLKFNKSSVDSENYLKRIFYVKFFIDDYLKSLNKKIVESEKSKYLSVSAINRIIVILIVLIIVLWFLPRLIPKGIVSFELFGFNLQSHRFNDLQTLYWFLTRKMIVLICLTIWFIVNPHWWRLALISSIIIYSFQFWEAYQDVNIVDSVSNFRVLPLVLLNVALVLIISQLIKYRVIVMDAYESINEEIDELLCELKEKYPIEVANTLKEIKKGKSAMPNAAYKNQLKALEKELAAKLDL